MVHLFIFHYLILDVASHEYLTNKRSIWHKDLKLFKFQVLNSFWTPFSLSNFGKMCYFEYFWK